MQTYDLQIYPGSDYNISFNLTDANSNPLNLSGYDISGCVLPSYSSNQILLNLNPQISNPTSGIVSISIPNSGLTGLPCTIAFYNIQINNGIINQIVLDGNVYIYPEVHYNL